MKPYYSVIDLFFDQVRKQVGACVILSLLEFGTIRMLAHSIKRCIIQLSGTELLQIAFSLF